MGFKGKIWPRVILAVITGLVVGQGTGCRVPRQISALQEENRQLEERLYQIADLLAECRRENRRLRQELEASQALPAGREQTPEAGPTTREQPPQSGGEDALPKIRVEGVPQPDPQGKLPPLEVPRTNPLERETPESPSGSVTTHPPLATAVAAANLSHIQSPLVVARSADSREVHQLELNPQFTGGWNADGQPGDEGITVLLEPRDAAGRLLRVAAPVSVVVVDPALPGEDARLGRWDLSADEVAQAFVQMPSQSGILLHLAWGEKIPVHSRLHLFVRLITSDGRKLQRDMPIKVELLPAVTGASPSRGTAVKPEGDGSPGLPGNERPLELPQEPRSARRPPVWSPIR